VHNKNLTKISYKTPSGAKIFKLFDDDVGELTPVTEYLQNLCRSNPPRNTLKNKGSDVVRFFSYLMSFDDIFFTEHHKIQKSSVILREIILQYPEYLTMPADSCSGIFSQFASKKNHPKLLLKSSAARNLSTINEFLKLSSIYHESMESLSAKRLVDIDTDENVFSSVLNVRTLTSPERSAICKNSVLAGVMKGGAKYTRSVVFKAPRIANRNANKNFVEKAFPVKSILPLIEDTDDIRDKLLWCILAGTGIRISEALQILVRDIDIPNERVFAIDPTERTHLLYGVDQSKLELTSYKGRTSPSTYFINPFKDIFFQNLQEYLHFRWSKNPKHEFLFVSHSSNSKGNPLIGSTEINTRFKSSPHNIQQHTVHSLRHFYGVWCRNFIKRGRNTYGFPVATVMSLMGHASQQSTDLYAIKDNTLLQAEIQYANELIAGNDKEEIERNVANALEYRLTNMERKALGLSKQK
jgi:integrase